MLIVLIGANGQLGQELRRCLPRLGRVVCTSSTGLLASGAKCEKVDLLQPGQAASLIEWIRPDVVVNAAGYTAVDDAEAHPDLAFRVNSDAVGEMAVACRKSDSRLVHYSSDYVFPGSGIEPWKEDSAPLPLNVYGASKLKGERAVMLSGCHHAIFRTSWLYGARGNNFLLTMLKLAGRRDPLRVVCDQAGAPTPFTWIADATSDILNSTHVASGTWHMSASGCTSWFEFARAIFDRAQVAGLIHEIPEVKPVASSDYPRAAVRPLNSRLDSTRLHNDFGIKFPNWEQGLDEVLATLASRRCD